MFIVAPWEIFMLCYLREKHDTKSNYRLLNIFIYMYKLRVKGIIRKKVDLLILSHVLFWSREFKDTLNKYWFNVLIQKTKNEA